MRTTRLLLPLATLALPAVVGAQQASSTGPVIRSAGPVFDVPNIDFGTPTDAEYKVAFEMARAAESPDRLNVTLESAARFLNMHARAGVPAERVAVAVVVHGPAGWELLGHEAYRARHGIDNPNAALIRELTEAGGRVILCGQTAAARGIPTDGLLDEAEVALSAMTAFVVLQEQGFRVNPW